MNTPNAREHANNISEFIFKDNDIVEVRNAAVKWSNFEGRDGYGRSFQLVLSDAVVDQIKKMGLYVREWENSDGDITYMTDIAVTNKDESVLPNIVLYTSFDGKRSAETLTFENMQRLDRGAYEKVLVAFKIRPKNKPDKYSTHKGWLRTIRCIAVPSSSDIYDKEYDEWLAGADE